MLKECRDCGMSIAAILKGCPIGKYSSAGGRVDIYKCPRCGLRYEWRNPYFGWCHIGTDRIMYEY